MVASSNNYLLSVDDEVLANYSNLVPKLLFSQQKGRAINLQVYKVSQKGKVKGKIL
jgi:hypothetical protein